MLLFLCVVEVECQCINRKMRVVAVDGFVLGSFHHLNADGQSETSKDVWV